MKEARENETNGDKIDNLRENDRWEIKGRGEQVKK